MDGESLVPEASAPDAPDIAAPALPSASDMAPDPRMERVLEIFEASATPPAFQREQAPSSEGTSPPEAAPAPTPPAPVMPAEAQRGGSSIMLLALAIVLVALCAGTGALFTVTGLVGSDSTASVPALEAPAPVVAPVAPEPAPAPTPSRTIDLTSDPDGAEVWEEEELLCVTPCKVAHAPGTALPRTFVFKRGGHADETVTLNAVGDPVRASLKKASPTPNPGSPVPLRPRPRPAPAPVNDDLRSER